jgi:anaerobic selenocysteine-containing dehydrogenase
VVVVDPRHSETAILADEWLPIKPGTDLALLLAMINVMVNEELYDKKFVREKTVGFDQLGDEIINYPRNGQRKFARYRPRRSFVLPGSSLRPNPGPHPPRIPWCFRIPILE